MLPGLRGPRLSVQDHPQRRRYSTLGSVSCQPGSLLPKGASEATAAAAPRPPGHHHAMVWAGDPGAVCFQHGRVRSQIQCSPAASASSQIEPWRATPADAAPVPIT